jgi:PAS domain S-box-containing protein
MQHAKETQQQSRETSIPSFSPRPQGAVPQGQRTDAVFVFLDELPDAAVASRGERVFYVNRRAEALLGHTVAALCADGQGLSRLVAPDSNEAWSSAHRQAAEGTCHGSYDCGLLARDGTRRDVEVTTIALAQAQGGPVVVDIFRDVAAVRDLPARLAALQRDAARWKEDARRKSTALDEILAHIESEKGEVRRQVTANIDRSIVPIVRALRKAVPPACLNHIALLEQSLREIGSTFGADLSREAMCLTPREMEICGMIRSRTPNKEIASLLGVSVRTVETHRNTIRKKLGLSHRAANLVTYLQSIAVPRVPGVQGAGVPAAAPAGRQQGPEWAARRPDDGG